MDINGNPVKISKMQAMTAILTWRREQANQNRKHLQTPVLFPDVKLESKGKFTEAFDNGHAVRIDGNVVNKIMASLSEWDKTYLQLASETFNGKAKDAISETTMKTRHRIVATENEYIPYTVNENQLKRDSEQERLKRVEGPADKFQRGDAYL